PSPALTAHGRGRGDGERRMSIGHPREPVRVVGVVQGGGHGSAGGACYVVEVRGEVLPHVPVGHLHTTGAGGWERHAVEQLVPTGGAGQGGRAHDASSWCSAPVASSASAPAAVPKAASSPAARLAQPRTGSGTSSSVTPLTQRVADVALPSA